MAKNTPRIPSREEFHRYASNLLSTTDFETVHRVCEGYQVNRVASALNWTLENDKYKGVTKNFRHTI